jgi:DNA-binding NtrC family response regulator
MSSRRILVVDDEPQITETLKRVLEADGHSVITASSGEEALTIVEQASVQLIICDNHMPGLSGIDTLKLVRVRHPEIMRIMLTGDQDAETPVRSINESGVYHFFRKPWNNRDLRTVIHFAFEVSRLEEEKQRLLVIARRQQAALQGRKLLSEEDTSAIEAELVLLAEDEAANA